MSMHDPLNEICKVAMMKATTALSKFLNSPVAIDMKTIEITKIQDANLFMDSQETVASLFTEITGNIKGASFLFWTQQSARAMCELLYHKAHSETRGFREEEISALSEISNIVIGNFLTAFAQALQLDSLMHRSAIFSCDNFGEIREKYLAEVSKRMNEFVIDIAFSYQHVHIKGFVVIMLEEKKVADKLKTLFINSNI